MPDPSDRLYELLPVIHRQRDAEQGYPLRALLRVIAEQAQIVEDDIQRLYENWFIETADEWVVPYIGDLIGYQPVHEAGEPGDVRTEQGRMRNRFLIPRREVANTLRYRRRKGALALLELLCRDTAGWPARAVEFFPLLGMAQALDHLRLERGRWADLRSGDVLERSGGPFDTLAHTVDVRRINSARTQGRYNIPEVGVFAFRLNTYTSSQTQACCVEEVAPNCFTFSVLGNNTPLYTRHRAESDPEELAGVMNLPVPITRRAFERRMADYYAEDRSLYIWTGTRRGRQVEIRPVPIERIVAADLSGWSYRPKRSTVAVDPLLGRIMFPPGQLPTGVWVNYVYAFPADIGGGEYPRQVSLPAAADGRLAFYRVGEGQELETLEAAIERWQAQQPRPAHAVIEILDNGVYSEQPNLVLSKGESLTIRAASRKRPVINLVDRYKNRPDSFTVTSDTGGCLTLDGLLITGRAVHIEGALDRVTIRHCTLVPGWSLNEVCEPRRPSEPSLELYRTEASVQVEHSIIGSIQVYQDEVLADPLSLVVSDSVVDATADDLEALGGVDFSIAHASASFLRSTIIGTVNTHAIDLAENSIFTGAVRVARSQRGCMRFCYVLPGSRTPRRYNCQPETAGIAAVEELVQWHIEQELSPPTPAERKAAHRRELERIQPQFESKRYGTPVYCRLALTTPREIRMGADDESEMGVYHDLFQPQREANLRARLAEYTPAGMDAGVIFAS